MSTRLLTTPGKAHELRDDLESLWFVLLYEALHFVKHNKPFGIHRDTLFDQVRVCPTTGVHTGGLGKRVLYSEKILMTKELNFGNDPFNTLVKQVYGLFQALNTYYRERGNVKHQERNDNTFVVDFVRKLDDCAEIERLLREALNAEGWPESCDKVEDQYPSMKHLTPEQKDAIALGFVNRPFREPGEPSGMKRKREEEEENSPTFESKRVKADPLWKRIWSKCAGLVVG